MIFEQAASLGLTPAVVLDMTVREMHGFARGCERRQKMDMTMALWTAWHSAAFQRAKKLPSLDRLLRKMTPPKRRTTRDLLMMARNITVQMGGKDLK